MSTQAPRQATRFIQWLRNRLMMRDVTEQLRYENFNQQPRSGPLPNLPGGVWHKMSGNDYYTRDARSLAEPPQLVFTTKDKMLTAGGSESVSGAKKSHITPGQLQDFGRYITYDESKMIDRQTKAQST